MQHSEAGEASAFLGSSHRGNWEGLSTNDDLTGATQQQIGMWYGAVQCGVTIRGVDASARHCQATAALNHSAHHSQLQSQVAEQRHANQAAHHRGEGAEVGVAARAHLQSGGRGQGRTGRQQPPQGTAIGVPRMAMEQPRRQPNRTAHHHPLRRSTPHNSPHATGQGGHRAHLAGLGVEPREAALGRIALGAAVVGRGLLKGRLVRVDLQAEAAAEGCSTASVQQQYSSHSAPRHVTGKRVAVDVRGGAIGCGHRRKPVRT